MQMALANSRDFNCNIESRDQRYWLFQWEEIDGGK
jgi:hypothetical protein